MAHNIPISEISPEERQRVIADQRFIRGRLSGLAVAWEYDWGQVPPGATLLLAAPDTDQVDVIVMPDFSEIAAGSKGNFGEERVAVLIYRPDGLPTEDGYMSIFSSSQGS